METVVRLAEETHAEEGVPAIVWGAGAFGILFLLLVITLIFGAGRPHA
jgi:hypothetical protein